MRYNDAPAYIGCKKNGFEPIPVIYRACSEALIIESTKRKEVNYIISNYWQQW